MGVLKDERMVAKGIHLAWRDIFSWHILHREKNSLLLECFLL